mmetsp:Transcript_39485/g.118219  ORF Transcript_39485/g.118219 Transcript_39485/m.118219 type:complete len:203 (+) Transcript_39485:451-1059(+)
MVPSGNHPAIPPEATCSSISFCLWAMSSLSSSNVPSAPVALKGTDVWPMAVAMVPMMGMFSKCPETSILTLACLAKGMKVTNKIVSRKEAWFEMITAGRPEALRVDRNSFRPSMSNRTQNEQNIATLHMRQVKTSTVCSRKPPEHTGFTAPERTQSFAMRKAGRVNKTNSRLKQKTATCISKPMATSAANATPGRRQITQVA